jgi:anti-sigma regulatory factor (Ser/Thr protein kinase)
MEQVIPWLLGHMPSLDSNPEKKLLVEVALEEIIVNIMLHAYGKKEHPIFFILKVTPKFYELTIKDAGKRFDPIEYMKENKNPPKQSLGGSGLKLIKAAFSQISYSFENQLNTLTCILNKD